MDVFWTGIVQSDGSVIDINDLTDAGLLKRSGATVITIAIGTSTGTVAAGDDARFTDARTPTAHATSHKSGGSDEVAVAAAAANGIPKAGAGSTLAKEWFPQGSAIADADGTLADITTKFNTLLARQRAGTPWIAT